MTTTTRTPICVHNRSNTCTKFFWIFFSFVLKAIEYLYAALDPKWEQRSREIVTNQKYLFNRLVSSRSWLHPMTFDVRRNIHIRLHSAFFCVYWCDLLHLFYSHSGTFKHTRTHGFYNSHGAFTHSVAHFVWKCWIKLSNENRNVMMVNTHAFSLTPHTHLQSHTVSITHIFFVFFSVRKYTAHQCEVVFACSANRFAVRSRADAN